MKGLDRGMKLAEWGHGFSGDRTCRRAGCTARVARNSSTCSYRLLQRASSRPHRSLSSFVSAAGPMQATATGRRRLRYRGVAGPWRRAGGTGTGTATRHRGGGRGRRGGSSGLRPRGQRGSSKGVLGTQVPTPNLTRPSRLAGLGASSSISTQAAVYDRGLCS